MKQSGKREAETNASRYLNFVKFRIIAVSWRVRKYSVNHSKLPHRAVYQINRTQDDRRFPEQGATWSILNSHLRKGTGVPLSWQKLEAVQNRATLRPPEELQSAPYNTLDPYSCQLPKGSSRVECSVNP